MNPDPGRHPRPAPLARSRGRALRLGLALALLASGAAARPASAEEAPVLLATWRAAAVPAPGGVLDPVDLAALSDGSVLVVDRGLGRLQRFGASGAPGLVYGQGPGAGALDQPFGVAVDEGRDRVIVADRGHSRLAFFGLDGVFREAWSDYPKPEALAVGLEGRVYAYERAGNNIVGRKADGSRDVAISVPFAQSTLAQLPHGLATDRAGQIWFASEAPTIDQPPVIWVFLPSGETTRQRTQVSWMPRDIAIDPADRVFLLDGSEGRLVTDFNRATGAHRAAPVSRAVRGIATTGPDQVALLEGPTAESEGGVRFVRYDGQRLESLATWSFPPLEPGWFRNPLRIAAAPEGGLVLVDELPRAQRFDAAGRGLAQLRRPGLQEALALPGGDWLIARTRVSASQDDLRDPDVAPPGTRRLRIERYRPGQNGAAWTRVWSADWTEALDATERTTILALAADPEAGRAYALDASGKRVLVFDLESGERLTSWPVPAAGPLPLLDLEVDPAGGVRVLDGPARRLRRLDAEGRPAGETALPAVALRFALDATGRATVITSDRRVLRLDAAGLVLASWNLPAPGTASPEPPSDIALGREGRVYVADRAEQAVHVFGPPAGFRVLLPLALGGAGWP